MQKYKANVLVVDDDPMLLGLLVDTLETVGYQVTGAQGGVAALDCLTNHSFDLMVTDIKMPDIDGIQLLKKVRRHYPSMPVLFITGYASPEMIGEASPDGFLAKPFRIQHIEALIEQTLAKKSGLTARSVRKILLVDHDDDFRSNLADLLNYSRYIPFSATDENEAMRELENGNFAAVITDIADPHFDGVSLTLKMRERYPETPVIAVGADDGSMLNEASQPSIYAGYLQKPFKLGSILDLLDKVTPSNS
jgi:DNA-binding NtrC family response regulator